MAQANDAMKTAERPAAASGGSADGGMPRDLERALRPRRQNIVPVRQPLALISQAQRSGGTLLARLFDGHPQCHAHPHELLIGHPRPLSWPELGLDESPESWYAKLKEGYLTALFERGRRKLPLKAPGEKSKESYPFLLLPSFQRVLFLEEVARRSPITSEREILDCYMTSLFNAWLDNENLRGPEKRWVVAFSPRRAWGEGLDRFFELYPDGRLISILRDPLSWYASAQGRDMEVAQRADLLELWKQSAREMVEADRRFGERVRIVPFDELVLDTDRAMRRLAGYLGIEFDAKLTIPTFNGYPVGANSSAQVTDIGVVTAPVKRYRKVLSDEEQELIRTECEELHREALQLAEREPKPGGAAFERS